MLIAYQQFETFSFVMYSSDRPSPFPSYLKLALLPYICKTWKPLVPCVQEKASHLTAFIQFTIDRELAPPLPAFPVGDLSGKVWSTLITTQPGGIYPKSSLGFAIYCVSSLPHQYIGASHYTCTAHTPILLAFHVLYKC